MPAMIDVSFPAGFTAADFTRADLIATLAVTSSDRGARSASPIIGTNPANDTRLPSSNTGVARDHTSGSFTLSALWYGTDQDFDTLDSSEPQGTSS